jgi:hypothetical protein
MRLAGCTSTTIDPPPASEAIKPCATKKCPADPVPSQGDVDTCDRLLGDPACGQLLRRYTECIAQKAHCGSDSRTDLARCSTELVAYQTCTAPPADAGSFEGG